MKYAIVSGKAASGKTRTLGAYAKASGAVTKTYFVGVKNNFNGDKVAVDEVPEEHVNEVVAKFKGSELVLSVQNGDKLRIRGNDKAFVDKISKYVP